MGRAEAETVLRSVTGSCIYMREILDKLNCGTMIIENGIIIAFNRKAEELTGVQAEDVQGRNVIEVCRRCVTCRELYNGGRTVKSRVVVSGGNLLYVERAKAEGTLVVSIQGDGTPGRSNRGHEARFKFSDIVGKSDIIMETIWEARKYARSEATLLITGESGTGKELFAQSIHNDSSRRHGSFVAVNCAALPESLLESELFGYEEGAFTGARRGGKQGLFSLADGGTIFLDEIGELSLQLQARLLRVLQEKQVMPVGGQKLQPVDVRVLSATNQNLDRAVHEGRFRKDLYFRLNVLHLQIPPLRERLEDIPELFKHFLNRLGLHDDENLPGQQWLNLLKAYTWPGNVRELEGLAERYAALGEENYRTRSTFRYLLSKLINSQVTTEITVNKNKIVVDLGNMNDMEKQIIIQAQKIIRGGKGELARVLGLSRTTLWKKLRKLETESRSDRT